MAGVKLVKSIILVFFFFYIFDDKFAGTFVQNEQVSN